MPAIINRFALGGLVNEDETIGSNAKGPGTQGFGPMGHDLGGQAQMAVVHEDEIIATALHFVKGNDFVRGCAHR
jgi:hypothetical protein